MQDLTFGEQVKIVLSRKNMTIKDLARKIEIRTKKKMSRQNLTQRLGRDNFQEQDMRMIAEILGCSFYLDILGDHIAAEKAEKEASSAVDNGEKKEQATAALAEKKPEEPVTRAPQGLEDGSGKETGLPAATTRTKMKTMMKTWMMTRPTSRSFRKPQRPCVSMVVPRCIHPTANSSSGRVRSRRWSHRLMH